MWYQIELPEVTTIAEVQYNAPPAGRGGGPAPGTPAGQVVARGGGPAPTAPAVPAPAGKGGKAAAAPPPELQVQVSVDGKTWSQPLAGAASSTLTTFAFTPVKAKFIRIARNAPAPNNAVWTIQNLRVFQAAATATK